MSTGVILLAAGSGRRFGGKIPKQFKSFKGQPLFLKSLKVFLKFPSVSEIVIPTSKGMLPAVSRVLAKIKTRKTLRAVLGGAFRGASVKRGLRSLSPGVDVVLVHDAARPLVGKAIVRRVEAAAKKYGAALAAWPLGDTLKMADAAGRVRNTIPRKNMWLAQTPQGFRRDIADQCLTHPLPSATDDVQLAERRGYSVKIVEGSPTNLKVTFPYDLKICEALN